MELQKQRPDTSSFFPSRKQTSVTNLTASSGSQQSTHLALVAPVASVAPVATTVQTAEIHSDAVSTELVSKDISFAQNLPDFGLSILGQNGKAYVVMRDRRNLYVLPVGGRNLNQIIREVLRKRGLKHRTQDVKDFNESLQAHAVMSGITQDVWYRVAPITGGIEVDLCDETHDRVRITAGKVETVSEGSKTLFYRTSVSAPMSRPAEVGDLKLLDKYLNLHAELRLLLIAWLTYTLAHPKLDTSKYVILVLNGHQGSGKSFLCNIILRLVDPNLTGIQILPNNSKDLAIAAQNAHVLCYDNIREVRESMADLLCIAATGGSVSCRQLFTDEEQNVTRLHVALVLNGIHSFVNQPDFAQRCLPLELLPIQESNRKSEVQLMEEFEADTPAILRGLFELIADVFTHLPNAKVTDPERMFDFSQWLAAMELAHGLPAGVYQGAYSTVLNDGQRDTLLDNLLAAAILEFAEDQFDGSVWSGKPSELLAELNKRMSRNFQRSREWPDNPIALSKRLVPLRAALMSQGIRVELSRGKHRLITITKTGGEQ